MNPLKVIFGTKNERDIKALKPLTNKINALEPDMQRLSDADLKAQTEKLRERFQAGETLDDLLVEAFATVREASVRSLKMRPYDVQIMGGIVLFQGKIAEMKTGEGKTLCATMPLFLMGLTGKGAHLVTVNDYLASRDAEEMGVLFSFLGLKTGCIVADMSDEARQEAYSCDITYGTNNEFAFDYLRDNMKFDLKEYVQKPHHYCIVDEVDSILIDEARTPLLISGPSEGNTEVYGQANKIIPKLGKDTHYTVDEKSKTAVLTEDGVTHLQEMVGIPDLFSVKNVELLHAINQALRAHALFVRDVDYVVNEGKVIIVDEFTGRLKTGSRWSDGLHQAIEAKENVPVKSENQTLASITFQNYFKLYERLAGMTGTAETEAEEFRKIYKLDVVVVPTNRPMIRDDQADVIYATREGKFKAIGELIKKLHHKGQPALVGTISIDTSEKLSNFLNKEKIPHEVLNAKQHEREAGIIAKAGQKGAVTIATNMAGRGTDIKLSPETIAVGGLFILGTERHESRRIDNQLRGRSGRQGDPGASKFFLSLEDDLMRIFGSDKIKGFMTRMGMDDNEPIEHKMISNSIAKAQKKVEGHNFDIRKHLLDYDNVMNEQRKVIYRIRKDILDDKDNLEFIYEMLEDVCEFFIETYRPREKVTIDAWPWDEMRQGFKNIFHSDKELSAMECSTQTDGDIFKYAHNNAKEILDQKLSDYDAETLSPALREILLSNFDNHWKGHLQNMDHMKEGINLRAYAQKDPLTEYKREAFHLFENMRQEIKKSVIDQIYSVHIYSKEEIEELKRIQQEQLAAQMRAHKEARAREEAGLEAKKKPITRKAQKVGRNDACPCGSGKKFKHCHGA